MKRSIKLLVVTVAVLAVAPVTSQEPMAVPAKIVTAWKKAGAQVGWYGLNNLGFRPGGKGKKEELPAFLFTKWKDGLLRDLPAPEQPFGLGLQGTSISDAGVKEIVGLKQLQSLNLGNTKVTDAGLKDLAVLQQLQTLSVSGAKVTDAGLKDLARLQRLEALHLGATSVTGAGLKKLAELKQLQILKLPDTNISDTTLKELVGLQQLRSLDLGYTKVTDAGLKDLARMPQLRSLDLSSCKLSEEGVAGLRRALPEVRIVRNPWEKHIHTNAKGEKLPYRLLLPQNHDPAKAYPLVVYLHGSGDRGTDNKGQLSSAGVFVDAVNRKKYPCYVVAPQCPGDKVLRFWNETVGSGLVLGVMQEVEKNHRIDAGRIYLMGISDGGWGGWALLNMYPNKFAAAVPICGRGTPAQAPRFAAVPIWVFHGENDHVQWAREMVAALKNAGGAPKYTEYKNAGHNIWGRVFNERPLFEWLFAQKIASP